MQGLRAKPSVVPRNQGAKLRLILRHTESLPADGYNISVSNTSISGQVLKLSIPDLQGIASAPNLRDLHFHLVKLLPVTINVYWKHFCMLLPPPCRASAY